MLKPALLSLAVLAAACAPTSTSTDTAADEQALRASLDGFDQALTAANDSALAAYYTDSAELMPPGTPAVNGRAGIRAFWASIWPLKPTLVLTNTALDISGDLAVARHNWTWSQPTTGGELRDHGKAMVVWRLMDGNWRITRDIWNSDLKPEESQKVIKP